MILKIISQFQPGPFGSGSILDETHVISSL